MLLGLSIYVTALLFIGLSVYKAMDYAKMPLHGRMELYPVPLEKGRHTYGGSYMEEPEWWRKPREISRVSEIIDMFGEMLFIKKLFKNQKSLWWVSYSFHLGIYVLIVWTLLVIAGALTNLGGASVSLHATAWTVILYYLTILTGIVGFIIATFGVFMLLVRRLSDPVLKKYTTPQEYFNLVLLLAALVSGIALWGQDLTFDTARSITADALTLSLSASPLLVIHLILMEVMFIYIPVSKMSHYVGKYFSFHKVLWENEPNILGSQIERQVNATLSNRATTIWSAPHITPPPVSTKES